MTPYIMDGEREAERLMLKTDPELVRRHLAWSGLGVGESFVDVGCGTGEVVVAACEINGGAPVLGIDADERRLAHARAACRRLGPTAARFHAARIGGPGSSGLEDERLTTPGRASSSSTNRPRPGPSARWSGSCEAGAA